MRLSQELWKEHKMYVVTVTYANQGDHMRISLRLCTDHNFSD